MDWLDFGRAALSLAAVPVAFTALFLVRRRLRSRALTYHDTTPPTPTVTTGQHH